MLKVENGAELVRRLAKTGTGEAKLAVARTVLADTWQHERRVASGDEVILALESAGAGEGTLDKARQIRDTGEWAGPQDRTAVPVEDQLLAEAAKPEPAPDKADPPPEPPPAPKPEPPPGTGTGARTPDRRPGDGRR